LLPLFIGGYNIKETQMDFLLSIWAEEYLRSHKLEDESDADVYLDMMMDRVNMIISYVIDHYNFKVRATYRGPWRSTQERPAHNSICYIRKIGMSLIIKAYYNVYDDMFYTSIGTRYPFYDVYMWAYVNEYMDALKNQDETDIIYYDTDSIKVKEDKT